MRAAALKHGTDPADLVKAGQRTQVDDARPIVQAAILARATGHLTKRLADTTDHDVVVNEILAAATGVTREG